MKVDFPSADAKAVPGAAIELVSGKVPGGTFRSVLFDFDGTISVIREGWQHIMIPLCVEELERTGTSETREELTTVAVDFVDRLTGKDTIFQMMELAEQIRKRGSEPLDAYEYKREYLDRLWGRIKDRIAGLKAGSIKAEEMVMEGSFELLESLKTKGVELYLASGTDHCYVKDEAAALGVDRYFGDNIFGAIDHCTEHSKAKIIQGIIEKHRLGGDSLLVFGDGFVEIEECKKVEGLAVGVASDEINRMGLNEWKRHRLIDAGADIIVTDYRDHEKLVEYLFS